MADNKPDYSKIWASNSPLTPYTFTDSDYLTGWKFIGSTPPARGMFDAWMKSADIKMKWLCDNAMYDDTVDAKISNHNTAPDAHADIRMALQNLLKRTRAYAVGEIAFSAGLPSWARLECVTAGTTAKTEPSFANITSAGVLVTDGAAVFIVDDIRDGNRVGDIVMRHTLRAGFVKANGAVVTAADYPRLLKFVTDNSLTTTETLWQAGAYDKYVYDSTAGTLRVPNLIDRFVEGSDAVSLAKAGIPDIYGAIYIGTVDGQMATFSSSGALMKAGDSPGLYSAKGSPYSSGTDKWTGGIKLQASVLNPIYGNSNTVQPAAIKLIAQIKY